MRVRMSWRSKNTEIIRAGGWAVESSKRKRNRSKSYGEEKKFNRTRGRNSSSR